MLEPCLLQPCFHVAGRASETALREYRFCATATLWTKILDFRGFDLSIILVLRGGIIFSIDNFLEMLSQQILVGIILVGRLGVTSPIELSCCASSLRGSPAEAERASQ